MIGLVGVGDDQVNLIKQAAEFGLRKGGAKLAGFLVYITDIHALGLPVAQGLSFPASYYWDQNDAARAFAKRFQAERKAMPTKNQASVYAGTLHFLKAMAQAGTDDPIAVNKAMRAAPVSLLRPPCHAARRWPAAVRRHPVPGENARRRAAGPGTTTPKSAACRRTRRSCR